MGGVITCAAFAPSELPLLVCSRIGQSSSHACPPARLPESYNWWGSPVERSATGASHSSVTCRRDERLGTQNPTRHWLRVAHVDVAVTEFFTNFVG